MEAHKSGKGRVFPQNNYRQSYQIRNRNCYGCGERGHFVRDCPTKRRKNGAQFKSKNQEKSISNLNQRPVKCFWDQQPVMGVRTDGSKGSNFKQENKSCHEIPSIISASNLQERFSSWPSHFSEHYSSSASDYSEDYSDYSEDYSDYTEDYSSTALNSLEDYSFAAYGSQFEDYLSSASESSSTLHSSEVKSSLASDSSQFSYSSASDSCTVYSSSDTDKSESQGLNEFKDCEEIQPLQCATSSMAHKDLNECLQSPIGTGVDSLSQITRQVSKESLDSAECHKVVQTMHNLSVLLLNNSSDSGNFSESDLQTLQSVICNLSQCLMKSTGVSKSTDISAFMPDKQLVAANSEETEKDCYAAEEKEDPVGQRFFQMPAEVYQSQMVNIEVELNIIKSEIRCLRTELEMDGLKKTRAGTHENGDTENLANKNELNNGSCPEVNLVIKENDLDYTSAPFSPEGSNWLPDLNLDPIMDDESFTGEFYINNFEDDVVSQNNISEEPIYKSSLNTTAHNPGQSNAEAETKQIEGQFRVLQEPRSCSESDIAYIGDYTGNTLPEDGATTESRSKIGSSIYIHELENAHVMQTLEENPCFESDSSWEQVLLEDGAMSRSPSKIGSPVDVHDLENVDDGHALGENRCLESDSTWEHINFNEGDHI